LSDGSGFLIVTLAFLGFFLLPGLILTRWFFKEEDFDLWARVPFALSLALALFAAVVFAAALLAWRWEIVQVTWIVIAGVLNGAGLRMVWARSKQLNETARIVVASFLPSRRPGWMPKAVLAVVILAFAILTLFTQRDTDDWSYYKVVRGFVDAPQFAGFTLSWNYFRYDLNLWWLFHAFLIRTFQTEILRLGQDYLPILLVPLAFLAFYSLARVLLPARKAALFALLLQAGLYVIDLWSSDPNVQLTGEWVLSRIDQDHTAAQFIFLPVYLTAALRFIQSGAIRWLAASFIMLFVTATIHIQGFIHAAILMSSFLAVHALVARRSTDLRRSTALGFPFLVALVVFASQLSVRRADLGQLAANHVDFPFNLRWLTFFSPTAYTLRFDLIGYPPLLTALVITPFLFLFARSDLAARFLLANITALAILLFVPPVFGVLSSYWGYSIQRLWYLFPAALVIAYAAPSLWNVIHSATSRVHRGNAGWILWRAALLFAVALLIWLRLPLYVHGAKEVFAGHALPPGAFETLKALEREAAVNSGGGVLAPRAITDLVPTYGAKLTPVVFRYPYFTEREPLDDSNEFYGSALLTSRSLEILRKYNVRYLIAPTDEENISQFDFSASHFQPLFRNSDWELYRVASPLEEDDLVVANTRAAFGEWQGAIDAYNAILKENPQNVLAYTGLGILLELLNKPNAAADQFKAAIRLEPTNVQAHWHLAKVYRQLGMESEAQAHLTAAGRLADRVQK
jgi:tetratricopeptide (TPR) repeat protein